MTLARLHELLCEAASPSAADSMQQYESDEIKELLQKYGDEMLRTLETAASHDHPGDPSPRGAPKRPAFPRPSPTEKPSNAAERLVCLLAQVDKIAAYRLLEDFRSESYNDFVELEKVANAPPPAPPPVQAPTAALTLPTPSANGSAPLSWAAPVTDLEPAEDQSSVPSAAELSAALRAETCLLRLFYAQRLLLLQCVQQLLVIIYRKPASPFFCAHVAELLQGDLPGRLLRLLNTGEADIARPLEQRLPLRLQAFPCLP